MPGYIMHLATAKMILEKNNITDDAYVNLFLLGNIYPDVKQGNDKKATHFWTDEMFLRFDRRPDVKRFKEKYSARFNEPFIYGYFCHLYLDAMYMERYWDKHFSFFDESMNKTVGYNDVKYIKVVDKGQTYSRSEFFSSKYYYGDYDRMNAYFVNKYKIISPHVYGACYEDVSEALRSMDEVYFDDACDVLDSMINRIQSLKQEYVSTTILDLKEIEELIENVSSELSFY